MYLFKSVLKDLTEERLRGLAFILLFNIYDSSGFLFFISCTAVS